MCAPDPPAAPDPKTTAAAQTGTNVSTAIANANLNNVNQVTPNGNLTYNQTGDYSFTDPSTNSSYTIPRFTATTTLSPAQQNIQNQSDAAKGNLAQTAAQQSGFLKDYLSSGMNLSGLPAAGTAPNLKTSYGPADGYSSNMKAVQDALLARQQPLLDQQKSTLDQSLANQGIKLGSAAYDRAQTNYGHNVNDAQQAAIVNSYAVAPQLASMDQNQATFSNNASQQQFSDANSARQQALQEQFALRNQPINETSALLSGSQVSAPNFVNTKEPTIPTTDYAGIVQNSFQDQMAGYNSQVAQQNSLVGGLFGLGAAGVYKYSDRRLKEDISKVGETDDGQNVYKFRYKAGGPMQLGLMAQEVEKKHPEAVIDTPSGYKAVDYGKALGLGAGLKEAA